MHRPAFLPATALLLTLTFPAIAGDNPYERLVAKGETACFSRRYDEAWLEKHPKQTIAAITASILADPDGNTEFRLGLRQRGHDFVFASGGCEWSEHANRDINDKRIIANFRKEAGADCTMVVSPSSDEEGAGLVLDPASDGRSLTVYTDNILATVSGHKEHWKEGSLPLGADDQVFRLDRSGPSACVSIARAFEE